MAEGYTEDDVRRVVDILDDDIDCAVWCSGCDSTSAARRVLESLAGAGKLLPEDRKVTVEDEIEWRGRSGKVQPLTYKNYDDAAMAHEFECAREQGAEFVSWRRRTIREFADGSTLVGPWVPVQVTRPLTS